MCLGDLGGIFAPGGIDAGRLNQYNGIRFGKCQVQESRLMSKKNISSTKVHAGSGGGYPLMRVIVLLFFLILFAVVGSMLVSQSRTYDRVYNKSQELARLEREAIANNDEVKTQQGKIGSDEYIEEIARDQLGLVKSGETVYQTGE